MLHLGRMRLHSHREGPAAARLSTVPFARCVRAFALTLGLIAAGSVAQAQGVRIAGSANGQAITSLAAQEFSRSPGKTVQAPAGITGTRGGLKLLCRGAADIVNTTRPILKQEIASCAAAGVEFVELPVALDATVVVVNPRNDFVNGISIEDLRRTWDSDAQGKIVRWNQANPAWTDTALKLYGPDAQFEGAEWFTETVLGPGREMRRDYSASVEDSVLIQGVARDRSALGFVPLSAYLENRSRLKLVPISPKEGSPAVEPTAATVASGEYQPLSRPIFLYVNAKALEQKHVREFLEYYLVNAKSLVQAARLVPLPDSAYAADLERLRKQTRGSVWDGVVTVGAGALETLRRQALRP